VSTSAHPIETIRVSKKGRDQLLTLKRHTKIPTQNILCRWAFCVSLSDPSPTRPHKIPTDSPLEMTWRVFGGPHHELYLGLLKHRVRRDGLPSDQETLTTQFRLHLHRGLARLAGTKSLRCIRDLVSFAADVPEG
jgi:DNA sulfur modification protein DndE